MRYVAMFEGIDFETNSQVVGSICLSERNSYLRSSNAFRIAVRLPKIRVYGAVTEYLIILRKPNCRARWVGEEDSRMGKFELLPIMF